ncbi:MAG: hypothetical protein WKF83_12945 [Nocardioidaceae bacterium]
MQLRLDAAEEELASAQADFRAGKLALHEARSDVARDTVENIQNGDPGLRAFGDLLRGAEPSTFSDEMSLQGSLTDAQTASIDEFDAGQVLLSSTGTGSRSCTTRSPNSARPPRITSLFG